MGRELKTTTSERPYQRIVRLQNNGVANCYDREQKEPFELDLLNSFCFLDKTFFAYKLKIRGKVRETDKITTEYNRRSQTVTLVDKNEETKQRAIVDEVPTIWGDKPDTGIIIYAVDSKGVIYQIEGSSSVLGQFLDFQKEQEAAGHYPDFTLSTSENKEDKGPKFWWNFNPAADSKTAPEAAIEAAAVKVRDYFKSKGLETQYLDAVCPDETETAQEEEAPETPAFK